MNMIEAQLRTTLHAISNNQDVEYEDDWIEQAGEEFKAALRRQLTPRDNQFKLRASNVGRPICQLQMEASGAEPVDRPYEFAMRMMLGDASEVLATLLLKIAKVNITGGKNRVEFTHNGKTIKGEDDIEIDDKVWDVKSASDWSFKNKWNTSWERMSENDGFGYVPQLVIYSEGNKARAGGWIVINKSSGEIKVVEVNPSSVQMETAVEDIKATIDTMQDPDEPFVRMFEAIPETYYGKETGDYLMPRTCTFCDFHHTCWPGAEFRASSASKAANPTMKWFVQGEETDT